MNKRYLVGLMTAAGLLSPSAHAGTTFLNDMVQVDGFGTLGGYKSDNENVRFRADPRARAGSDGDWRFDGDTILGLQGTVNPMGAVKGVIQMVSHKKIDGTTYDGNWRPLTEWAYASWDVNPTLNWKVGRVVAPLFLMSDSRNLGYSQTAVRPPHSVYAINPVTNLDGTTANWDHQIGDTALTLTGMYGKTNVSTSAGKVDAKAIYGGAIKANKGDWTARAGYTQFKLDNKLTAAYQATYDGIKALDGAGCTNCTEQLNTKAPLTDITVKMFSYALVYEHDDYTLQAEYVSRIANSIAVPDVKGWYIQGSKRFGDWTPYGRIGEFVNTDSIDLQPSSVPLLASLNDKVVFGNPTRTEIAVGARWDLAPKLALKAEYSSYNLKKPASGTGILIYYPTPTQATKFNADGGKVNVVTLNLDFVF